MNLYYFKVVIRLESISSLNLFLLLFLTFSQYTFKNMQKEILPHQYFVNLMEERRERRQHTRAVRNAFLSRTWRDVPTGGKV